MMQLAVQAGTGDRRADPRHRGRGQDRHRRDGPAGRQHRLVHLLRAGRRSAGRDRRLRRGAAQHGRPDGGADREAGPAGLARVAVESVDPYPVGAHGHHGHPDRLAVRRPLPDPQADRRAAGWRTSTSPRTRCSAGASRSRSSTSATRATTSSSSASTVRRRARPALSHPNIVSIYDRGEAAGHVLHRHGAPRRAEPEGARSSRAARRRRRSSVEYARQILAALALRAPARDRAPRHQAAQRASSTATAG